MYKNIWYCRWDGKTYKPLKETDRDGFCCSACKQALYRARKKYVTTELISVARAQGQGVTPKTRASSGTTQGKKRKKH